MTPELLESLEEHAVSIYRKPQILDPGFPKQSEFINDQSKRKALWCTRRSAKSYTSGLYLADVATKYDGCNCLYLGLTRLSAKGIIWKDVLKQIDRNNDLGMQFNGSELTATTRNGSVIYITGVDAEEDEMHKLLGKKWKLVILDEAQAYSIDLRALIYGVLGPAVVDQGGTICMLGTAGNLTQGLFYDVTTNKEPGWKLFQWSAHDNPYVAKQWKAELEDIQKNRPMFMETSLFKQWYLNKWVVDEEAKVYKFNPERNLASHLPYELSDWHYVLGLDLAHSPDSTAFVVGAYHEGDPTLYLVYSYKSTEMDITDVAEKVRELDVKYKFEVKVVDGANKQAVAELNNRHGTNLIPADKTGKVDFITLMNDDFIQGKIKCLPETKELQDEYQKLIWITDANGKVKEPKKENPVIHQDLADGALYLWRYCYQYLFTQTFKTFKDFSKQESWEPLHIEKLQEQVKNSQNPDHLELDPTNEGLDDWNMSWNEVI